MHRLVAFGPYYKLLVSIIEELHHISYQGPKGSLSIFV